MQRESHTFNGHTFELVHCPPGTFMMGSPEDEEDRRENETQHPVTLTRGFALGVVPVTQGLYQAVTGKNPSGCAHGDDAPSRPVEELWWIEAVRFCNALSEALGLRPAYRIEGEPKDYRAPVTLRQGSDGFRLPTEAEWEYAARSGGDAFIYAGGDVLTEVGFLNEDELSVPVGSFRPTRWGLYDMSGNVGEWCWDKSDAPADDPDDACHPEDYPPGPVVDPIGPERGVPRVVRGHHRVARRDGCDSASAVVGFRLARSLPG